MKKPKILILVLFCVILLTSCQSFLYEAVDIEPFVFFDEGAVMYAHIPVTTNEDFTSAIIFNMLQGIEESDVQTIIDRTESINIAIFPAVNTEKAYVQLIVEGNFPLFLLNLSLNKNNGWEDKKETSDGKTYSWKENQGFQLATVASNLIFISSNNIIDMQKRYNNPQGVITALPTIDTLNGAASDVYTLFKETDLVSLYVPEAKSLLSSLPELPLDIPLGYAFVNITSFENNNVTLKLQMKLEDSKTTPIALTLFKIFAKTQGIEVVEYPNNVLLLDNLTVNSSAIFQEF